MWANSFWLSSRYLEQIHSVPTECPSIQAQGCIYFCEIHPKPHKKTSRIPLKFHSKDFMKIPPIPPFLLNIKHYTIAIHNIVLYRDFCHFSTCLLSLPFVGPCHHTTDWRIRDRKCQDQNKRGWKIDIYMVKQKMFAFNQVHYITYGWTALDRARAWSYIGYV